MNPKIVVSLLLLFSTTLAFTQSKNKYLKVNRFDLRSEKFTFPQTDFNIIGFGAYHGSVKTEEVEYELLSALTQQMDIPYYIIESDFSTAHLYNEYLATGDLTLLKQLVKDFGAYVPQDKAVEVYEKWKKLKALNDQLPVEKRLTVVGTDWVVNYKNPFQHLIELSTSSSETLTEIQNQLNLDTTDFNPFYNSYTQQLAKKMVEEYETDANIYGVGEQDVPVFKHLIATIKYTFEQRDREQEIYENYLRITDFYDFKNKPQFVRYGFFHLEKQREGNMASFFTRLIENNIYPREKILTIIGYLTKSRVFWEVVYDKKGNYQSYTTEGGFGIGDYWKEYFKGIKRLKKNQVSDLTLFRLNQANTPYADGQPDLMEIKMLFDKSNKAAVKGKSTTEFLDYAVLIRDSKANMPIEEL